MQTQPLIGIDGATHVREQQSGALAGGGCNQRLLETSASQSVVHGPPVVRGRPLVVREVTRNKSHMKFLNFNIV